MIRFQICIFDILNTADQFVFDAGLCCDSLSNLYLWHIKYSFFPYRYNWWLVVIRFQICIFDILNTADQFVFDAGLCCDSLSNLYLWHIKYSTRREISQAVLVVIRFQICIFDILNTAMARSSRAIEGLWFAFKFVSLTY